MQIHRRGLLQFALASTLASPVLAQGYFDLGREWEVTEVAPDGRYWEGRWVRRGDSNTFDAEWRDSATGGVVRDVIDFWRVENNSVILHRHGNDGRYFGDLSPDGRRILHGSASWYGAGYYWTARIHGR